MPSIEYGGYYDSGREGDIPWSDTGRQIWYSIINMSSGSVRGYTASKSGKKSLLAEIERVSKTEEKILIIAIWSGQYYTSLFLVDPLIAISKLQGVCV